MELVKELENRTSRTQDLVMVCRRVAFLAPGDVWAVGKLHEAALADRNATYARAVEHVLAVLTPGRARIEPPALADQVEQPDAVRAMLFRDSIGARCKKRWRSSGKAPSTCSGATRAPTA